MSLATFVNGGTTLTFSRTPNRPDISATIVQPQRKTAGDIPYGYTHLLTDTVLRLRLRMTSTEKNSLLTFFQTTVSGMAKTFTYTDTAGTALTVRFNIPKLTVTETIYGSFTADVELLVVP